MKHALYIVSIEVTYKVDTPKKKGSPEVLKLENQPLILNTENINALPAKTVAALSRSIASAKGKKQQDVSVLKYSIIESRFSSKINYYE